MVDSELFRGSLHVKLEYILDNIPAIRTMPKHTFTLYTQRQFTVPSQPANMFLEGGRRPVDPEEVLSAAPARNF